MGKSSAPTIGFWYRLAFHHGITIGPIDVFLGMDGGDKAAWRGALTASGTIHINQPNLWGGEKDQGGIVGDLDVMFGEPTQEVNSYLASTFGDGTTSWRGFSTLAFKGGRYGAMNPYPQKPSYKFRRIKEGWDDACWYPEKAEIPMGQASETISANAAWEYQIVDGVVDTSDPSSIVPPASGYLDPAPGPFGRLATAGTLTPTRPIQTYWRYDTTLWLRKTVVFGDGPVTITGYVENGFGFFLDGELYHEFNFDNTQVSSSAGIFYSFEVTASPGTHVVHFMVLDEDSTGEDPDYLDAQDNTYFFAEIGAYEVTNALIGANPAHVLYESRTNSDMGREPAENLDDASFRAAAEKLYLEGFGICPRWDPAQESVEDFEKRICRLIGGSLNRSLEDGKWYLDLARGDYVLDDLPILTDDDILSFKESPTTLDDAINSVSVKYFDPEAKAYAVTAPARSLGLVAAFGQIHQTYEYPEIPTPALAGRVATREVLSTTTPTRSFDNAWKPTVRALRPNQYFRLQAPKRGIADMVCLVADKQSGTLKSGAIQMKVVQDIYGMPLTSFVQHEPGVDTRPPQTPNAIVLERAIEAPYIEVAAAMARAELAALPEDIGFALAMAVAPAGELDFTMMVDAGAGYTDEGTGHWAASATVNEAAGRIATSFTLANGKQLDQVLVGMAALWDEELVRVDAIDAGAGTITLARSCADTTPQGHAANSRLWFYEVGFGYDRTEYADGETVEVKLLTRTGSQLLAIGSATPMAVEFAQRLARPYPPAKLRINSVADPSYLFGELTVEWVHRDRVLQADQLVDTEAATIGPEAGTTYTMRTYLDDVLEDTQSAIAGTSASVTPSADGVVRIEVESERDGLISWQANTRQFAYTAEEREPLLIQGEAVTIYGDPIYLE